MHLNREVTEKRMEKTARNILLFLENKTDDYQNRIALGIRTVHGWREFTYKGIGRLSRKIACYLINNLEVRKGDRLAILSESRPEYGAGVFASVMSGMTTVPLDIKLTKYELKSILSDCLPTVMIVSQAYLEIAKDLQKEVDSIKFIISLDESSNDPEVPSVYALPNNYEAKWRHRSSKSTALIIYTSGTTGAPKGVEISFNNMLTQLNDMSTLYKNFFGKRKISSILSILPMNHLFELTVGFSMILSWGLSIYYTKSLKPKDILSIMQEKNINFMIVVPAFLKLLKAGIETEVKNSGPFARFLFKTMFAVSKCIPSYRLRKLMFAKIHKKFGGKFFGCISGGAPLDVSVGEFFETIGIRVFQGYGLTETSPVVSVNYDRRNDIASVGKPLKSVEAKVDSSTGELLLRGPSVMKGYYNRPDLTSQAIDEDGWLHTGDIADINEFGHIHITGRIKNMIVLSGGKKVFPEEVESVLGESENFSEVCVLGSSRTSGAKEGTEDIVAVIVPSQQLIDNCVNDEILDKCVRDEVKRLSLHLAAYKRPVNIIVNKDPLPKTTTRKIKRKEVKELVKV
ncbi:MAG: AMP-binding protein [Clostridium sp.]|nr:AMP-binding protein [Clostridium sp.]